jgi:CHASE1-domain containing sensor protein
MILDYLENLYQRSRLSQKLLLGGACLLGLGATGMTTWLERQQVMEFHQARFQRQAEVALEHARDSIKKYVVLLQAVGALYDASSDVSREDFRDYAQSFLLEQNFPGVFALGYLPQVNPEAMRGLEALAGTQGLPAFQARLPSTAGGPAMLAPVWYVEPFSGGNTRLLGRDLMANTTLAAAMAQARGTGHAAMSGPVKLVEEWGEGQRPAVLLFYPVYRKGQPHFTEAQRASAVQGYAFAALRVDDILTGIGDELVLLVGGPAGVRGRHPHGDRRRAGGGPGTL